MNEKLVDLFPVTGVQVKVDTSQKLVIVHLPCISGFGSPDQEERQERAYCLLREQAAILRDSLTAALNRLKELDGQSAPDPS
jgi:hypothetical protein